MSRNKQQDENQLEFNWTYLQRKTWINEAVLTPRKAKDGQTVMPDKQRNLLHKLNEHYGKNNCAWPSIKLLAVEMDCHRMTVIRAIQVLVERQIISVDNDETRKGRNNLYRIIWSELQLLEPTRREAWLRMLFGQENDGSKSHVAHVESHVAHVESHVAHVESHVARIESHVARIESHVARPELLKNKPIEQPKNKPLPVEGRSAHGDDPWKVVVVSLSELGMGDSVRAASRARERGMSPDEVSDWIQRFVQLTAANPEIHVGYLHKWLFGRGRPPWIEMPIAVLKKPPKAIVNTDYVQEALIAGRVRKAGKAAGKSRLEIEEDVARALARQFGRETAMS